MDRRTALAAAGFLALAALVPPAAATEVTMPVEPLDFATLVPPGSPNRWLVAPPSMAPAATVDGEAPCHAVALPDLIAAWQVALADQLRLEVLYADAAAGRFEYAQRTRWLGFVDRISVRLAEAGGDGATLAVYSRSQVGYYDFGANRARVETWLAALAGRVGSR